MDERPKSREETPSVGNERPEVHPTFHGCHDACVRADQQHEREFSGNIPFPARHLNHSQGKAYDL